MTSEGLGEMFEGDSADTCAGKFPLVSMGGRADGLACADPEGPPSVPVEILFNFHNERWHNKKCNPFFYAPFSIHPFIL